MSHLTIGSYGVDAVTGAPLPRVTTADLAAIARSQQLPPERVAELTLWHDEVAATPRQRGLRYNLDPRDLAEAGWGVIFAAEDPAAEAIHDALADLITWREDQAGSVQSHFFRVFRGSEGYRRGESNRTFLARHRVGPGSADPNFMPYYLLLVGGPEQIPYSFQYQLDVEYAVGRIAFDTVAEYRRYAASVVAAEEAAASSKRVVLFGPRHLCDPPTDLSVGDLVAPLAEWLPARAPGWDVETVIAEQATKRRLQRLLGGEETPALLLTAGHGVLFRPEHPQLQLAAQGAIVCQDWPGHPSPVLPETYVAAADVPDEARLQGLVAFHFACYSAGTPEIDDFTAGCGASEIAPHPFVARLPQRLLGHPRGGALAAIGHVERAWECSIAWPGVGRWIQAFEEAFEQLLTGYPVGAAMEAFGKRYAELASDLHDQLETEKRGGTPNPELLAGL